MKKSLSARSKFPGAVSDVLVEGRLGKSQLSVRCLLQMGSEPLGLRLVVGREGLDRLIQDQGINRPAQALSGYMKHFAASRVQFLGAGELAYLKDLPDHFQQLFLVEMVRKPIPCVIMTQQHPVPRSLRDICKEFQVPLLTTTLASKDFMPRATVFLQNYFAPRTALHGTLVDIRGVGTLLRGKSGIGKSECALGLVERGYSLVADDFVYVKRASQRELVGTSSPLNRGYMECRGIGIINLADIFGVRSIRLEKTIDLVITFLEWQPGMDEERTGLDPETFDILGVPVRHAQIPVRPGRDMVRLVEAAAMVQSLRRLGHDCALEFNERLISHMRQPSAGQGSKLPG
jgi:HPr kinase/phosphorylase